MIDYVQHVLEIEEIKKEHDKLMINKVTKYENEITKLKKEIDELKEDNKKLAEQVSDKANLVGKLRNKGLL